MVSLILKMLSFSVANINESSQNILLLQNIKALTAVHLATYVKNLEALVMC